MHDEIATDKRNPTLYANGPVFGAGTGNDTIVWVDPVEHRAYEVKVPIRDVRTWDGRFPMRMPAPSPYWGSELVIDAPATPHNPMLDHKGRLWVTSFIRDPTNQPDFCRPGSSLAFFPRGQDGRIDDPNGGWKGRGIWSNYAQHAPWHIEGPKGTVEKPVGKLVKFQLRPDPLAK